MYHQQVPTTGLAGFVNDQPLHYPLDVTTYKYTNLLYYIQFYRGEVMFCTRILISPIQNTKTVLYKSLTVELALLNVVYNDYDILLCVT